ncbi:MAG: type I DNA topoisomerase [Parcubacteria group bacterium]|nr:MAG: type I DNA topoisomerase [Parcubacteria group bacterium]
MSKLVIVESPTKAKTIKGFLGRDYKVESSYGHVRDLPVKKIGVDIDNNFEPTYTVPTKAKKVVEKLKDLAKDAEVVYFATDEDREGEAISWHLEQLLDVAKKKQKRIVFHEITKKAIEAALANPRDLDLKLVDAQQARRILDRLVGYKLSPLLWKKVAKGLSAGRVQSVALRLIVEREKERADFKTQEYWTVEGLAKKDHKNFKIALHKEGEKILGKFDIDEAKAKKAAGEITKAKLLVADVKAKENIKSPLPPFITSTLQQDANRRFGYSAKQTMMIAQQLYEGITLGEEGPVGLITYMRTDSVNLSDDFKTGVYDFVKNKFGADYAISGGRVFKKKSKLAQEAHEAIRPTEVTNDPDSVKAFLDSRQHKIYSLIWQRAVASQMADSKTETTTVAIDAVNTPWQLKAVGSVIKFAGWQTIYQSNGEEEELPVLKVGDEPRLINIDPLQHFTTPPARYSEAGLVKALEALGIGRPSTYAPTIATIIERKYVEKEEKRLKPTEIGTIVTNLLVEHFAEIVDYNFTAKMEDDLDEIADKGKPWQPIIADFYKPFAKNLATKEKELDKKEITEKKSDEICDKCGQPMVEKLGRFGRFLACSNYPECKNTKPLDENGEVAAPEVTDEKCPNCGQPMIFKQGRFGRFLACSNYPTCKTTKNVQKSLGVKCPVCQVGDMVEKKTKRGKPFYACNKYPDCQHAVWSKPTGELCPDCGQLLLYAAKNKIKCEKCRFSKMAEPKDE